MKEILKLGGILLLVTAISGAVLAYVNLKTQPVIAEQARLAKEAALTEALPTADKDAIVYLEDQKYYIGYRTAEKQEIAGYIFQAAGGGYSSTIQTMVGIDTTGVIQGLKIIHQVETPGLGTKIEEIRYGDENPWFQQQFLNKTAAEVALTKDKASGTITAITGATISSRAVTNSIANELKKMNRQLGLE